MNQYTTRCCFESSLWFFKASEHKGQQASVGNGNLFLYHSYCKIKFKSQRLIFFNISSLLIIDYIKKQSPLWAQNICEGNRNFAKKCANRAHWSQRHWSATSWLTQVKRHSSCDVTSLQSFRPKHLAPYLPKMNFWIKITFNDNLHVIYPHFYPLIAWGQKVYTLFLNNFLSSI